jgi:glycosyltransferase involved in cell wall biosynthesis
MTPSLSVVIPCHNNARNLDWILDVLMPQLRRHDEVVVVDDHSASGVPAPRRAGRARLALVRRDGGSPNRASARNEGWRAADGDVVVFLDGDMVPSPGFAGALKRLHAEHRGVAIKSPRMALTRAEQKRGKRSCLRDVATPERWIEGPRPARRPRCARTSHWYLAASNALSVERRCVEQIGGWDEEYQGWGEEDMDFAYRLHLAGLSFVFPEPRWLYAVHLNHAPADGWATSLDRNARRFVRKFPEVYEVRLPAYQQCGIALARDSGKPSARVRPSPALAYYRPGTRR